MRHGATGSPALGSPWGVDGVGSSSAPPPPLLTFGADRPTASYQPSRGWGAGNPPAAYKGDGRSSPAPLARRH